MVKSYDYRYRAQYIGSNKRSQLQHPEWLWNMERAILFILRTDPCTMRLLLQHGAADDGRHREARRARHKDRGSARRLGLI
jgi:hypothetical protein